MIKWRRKGCCPTQGNIERFWHAGLNSRGTLLFVSSVDDEYFVWDIAKQEVVWRDSDLPDPDALDLLADWISAGYVRLESPTLTDSFRVFGIHHNNPLLEFAGQSITVQTDQAQLFIRDASGDTQSLPFEAFSGDWAVASFSDNGEVIAVVEPYYVTLYEKCAP